LYWLAASGPLRTAESCPGAKLMRSAGGGAIVGVGVGPSGGIVNSSV
jgi:hypothetical protein